MKKIMELKALINGWDAVLRNRSKPYRDRVDMVFSSGPTKALRVEFVTAGCGAFVQSNYALDFLLTFKDEIKWIDAEDDHLYFVFYADNKEGK